MQNPHEIRVSLRHSYFVRVLQRNRVVKYDPEEQYQSMIRAFREVEALATNLGKHAVIGDDVVLDKAKTFFYQCYHFKDWLKKDARIHRSQDVEDFINSSHSLSITADLCNSFKHAGLNRPARSGQNLSQINMAYSIDMPLGLKGTHTLVEFKKNPTDGDTFRVSHTKREGNPIATAVVILTIGSKKYNALDIAKQCLHDWQQFLLIQGISFTEPI